MQQPEVREDARDLSKVYTHRGQLAFEALDNDEAEKWSRKAMERRKANRERAISAQPAAMENVKGR